MSVVNLTSLVGKDVYTRGAKYVGKVDDSLVDTERGNVYGFAVAMSKESFLYGAVSKSETGTKKSILIPYREVLACDDVVLVTVPKKYETKPIPETEEEEGEELPGDLLIAISIIDPGGQIDLASVRLHVDERDVTADATVTSAVVTYIPEPPLDPGRHRFDRRLPAPGGP